MKTISFIVWKESSEFVAQCLNIDVASHGNTLDEAIKNFKKDVEKARRQKKDLELLSIEIC
jgi:hypothetical protein